MINNASIYHLLHEHRKITNNTLNHSFLNTLEFSTLLSQTVKPNTSVNQLSTFQHLVALSQKHYNQKSECLSYLHPLSLQTLANDADNPTWNEAVNGPNAEGFWEAMRIELDTLKDFNSWDVVDITEDMNILSSVWAFKVKRFPDGLFRKLKARFCVRGFEQKYGIDYFETFAPVVKWTTVRLLLTLSLQLNLSTRQVDYTAAFLHAPVDTDIYVQPPRGFEQPGKVFKLKRSLYGLKQAPRNFFLHLKQGLLKQNFCQSDFYPCLFIHNDMVCVTYVDDCLFFAPNAADTDQMIQSLRTNGYTLDVEDDVAGYLGVHLQHNDDKSITLTQKGLIDRIIKAAGLEGANSRNTPAETDPLGSDKDGTPY